MNNSSPDNLLRFEVKEFVDYFNQTIEYAYNRIAVIGEIANIRLRNNVIYFDLKDNEAKINFWAYKNILNTPIEDGMIVEVIGTPRLHPQYGFKLTAYSLKLIGEGSIKKSAELLKLKLEKEGLFDISRKRIIPYPPKRIGLITSIQSAAYVDFIKVLSERLGGIEIYVIDVLVQGDKSVDQIVGAINRFNNMKTLTDVIVITRGGGSPEDLQFFNSEKIVRSISSSRIPTLVAIGHEIDQSLAELVADSKASTPSNAAELIVPDKNTILSGLISILNETESIIRNKILSEVENIKIIKSELNRSIEGFFLNEKNKIDSYDTLVKAYDPFLPLKRGYALIKKNNNYIERDVEFKINDNIEIELESQFLGAKINQLRKKNDN